VVILEPEFQRRGITQQTLEFTMHLLCAPDRQVVGSEDAKVPIQMFSWVPMRLECLQLLWFHQFPFEGLVAFRHFHIVPLESNAGRRWGVHLVLVEYRYSGPVSPEGLRLPQDCGLRHTSLAIDDLDFGTKRGSWADLLPFNSRFNRSGLA
jgi:hypothetical protein